MDHKLLTLAFGKVFALRDPRIKSVAELFRIFLVWRLKTTVAVGGLLLL